MAELPQGTVFAGHRIEGVAGRGGMGVVYRATHLALDHVVALKVIARELAEDATFRERFVRESRMAVSIRHPNVVQVRHAGEEDGVLFVTMDFVDGFDLRALILAEGGLEPRRAAAIIGQVAAALDAAHDRGLVHRDVKPANVLISDSDGGEHAYLTDFGLTKRMTGATELTASGSFIGTLEYTAPEQIRGGDLDARTDVYALGGVAFAALAGEPPFARVEGDVAKLYAHLNDAPPKVSERTPGLPRACDAVIARALAKDPAERFATAGELARALGAAAGAPEANRTASAQRPQAEPTTESMRRGGRPRGRRLALAALAVLATAGAIVAATVLTDGGEEPEAEPAPAEANGPAGAAGGSEFTAIPAGEYPVGVEVADDRVLVASRHDGRVSAFNARNGAEIESRVIEGAQTDALTSGFGFLWAADGARDLLVQLDPETLEPTGVEYPTGDFPREPLVTDDVIWVVNRGSDDLTRVDPEGGTHEEVSVGTDEIDFPRRLAADGERMWVAFRRSGVVQAYDIETGEPRTEPVELGGGPQGMYVGDDFVWVANTDLGLVQKISRSDPAREVEEVGGICDEPRDVTLAFGSLWTTCKEPDLVRFDPRTGERARTNFRGLPETLAVSENPDRIWVAGGGSGNLYEIPR